MDPDEMALVLMRPRSINAIGFGYFLKPSLRLPWVYDYFVAHLRTGIVPYRAMRMCCMTVRADALILLNPSQ